MKTTKVLQAISVLLIFVIAVSCRSNRSTTGTQYPRSAPTQTPTKETTVYVESANLPPGQAKKVYGSQSAKAYAPGQQKKYAKRHPLIIVYTPGIVINKYSDGRYYYRSNAGHTYWKGYDGRYYIDERHLKGMEYEAGEYDDWKFKGQKNDKAQGPKGKEEEKLNVNQKSKDAEDIAKVKEQKGNGQNQKIKDDEQKGNGQNQKAKDDEQKGNGQNQKAKDTEEKGKGQSQKEKDDDSKGKEQTDQKAKDENSQKGKAKSKDKG